ncbi:MAG: ferritin family protein [Desulfovibrionales bacterium]|nr:ferritin family protein [Desulfovibrionales bacterium]
MAPPPVLEILKQAYLLEQQGKTLYETAQTAATHPKVASFFHDLAQEEAQHMVLLETQMKAVTDHGKFTAQALGPTPEEILDSRLTERINTAGFEATAVTAAIAFEEKAMTLYSQRSQDAQDPEERKLYHWLSTWESTHLKKLLSLQESLIQRIWNDNSFWPF